MRFLEKIQPWIASIRDILSIISYLILILGAVIAGPWAKNKIESALTQLNNIQSQLQTQNQKQLQNQKQDQAQLQKQTQSNVQQAEFSPQIKAEFNPHFNAAQDTATKSPFLYGPIEMDTIFPCNEWISIRRTHVAMVRFDCFENSYDSVEFKAKIDYNVQEFVIKKNRDMSFEFELGAGIGRRIITVHFRGFYAHGYVHAKVKYIDPKYLEKE